jgi:hypothetical protein
MSAALWTNIARAFRRLALPLASYYAVTLGLPLANGAARGGDTFVEHALVVFLVPPTAIVLACAVHTMLRSLNRLRLGLAQVGLSRPT